MSDLNQVIGWILTEYSKTRGTHNPWIVRYGNMRGLGADLWVVGPNFGFHQAGILFPDQKTKELEPAISQEDISVMVATIGFHDTVGLVLDSLIYKAIIWDPEIGYYELLDKVAMGRIL